MPRKPKLEKKTFTVVVNGAPMAVVLHPPTAARRSWYAYWNGLVASKSTGCPALGDAVAAAEQMLRSWKSGGGAARATPADAVLTDEEFDQIQRAHFTRSADPAARARAAKTLSDCLEAISAFRDVTGLSPISLATPDHCGAFQRRALELPKNWRKKYPNSKEKVGRVSANTVLKWSRQLQAAFERANKSAGKKCVRGVIVGGVALPESKLLTANPWTQFRWAIEGAEKPIRQFDDLELVGFLDFLATKWAGVGVAAALAKVCLWSSGRRAEVTALSWDALRAVVGEYHFATVGKWGVEKWFRVPAALYEELSAFRTGSPFVFEAYNAQLRGHYARAGSWRAKMVGDQFKPVNLGDWFHERIAEWSASLPKGRATTHIFRKTSLQYARSGEDVNRQVARDARVSEEVMMTHYVRETDEEMRASSNRTYRRIAAALRPHVAQRYGNSEAQADPLLSRLEAAKEAGNWPAVARLAAQLTRRDDGDVRRLGAG